MKVEGSTPEEYIANISEERQAVFQALRKAINDNLPEGMQEKMSYGMLGYVVPKSVYPNGYHCDTRLPLPFANLASQKNFIAFYHMGMYANEDVLNWFKEEYAKRCKYKIDMGKSCVRFKRLDDIPVDLIGELMTKISTEEWITTYENAFLKK